MIFSGGVLYMLDATHNLMTGSGGFMQIVTDRTLTPAPVALWRQPR